MPSDVGPAAESVAIGVAETVAVRAVECEREPLVPVTVTVNDPIEDEVKVRVEVPVAPDVSVTLAGFIVMVGPLGEEDVARETVPAKLFRLVMVTVDVAEEPAATVMDDGLSVIEKSGVLEAPTVTGFEVDSVSPLESVTVSVTVNVPCAEYAWVGDAPDPVELSPKFQLYVNGDVPPDTDDVKVT